MTEKGARKKRDGEKREKKIREVLFSPVSRVVFLFHGGFGRFFPCSVRSGESCGSGAHVKTGREKE